MWRVFALSLLIACGGNESEDTEESTEESAEESEESTEEESEDEDEDEDLDVEPNEDDLDLSVDIEEHALDESTTERVAADTRGIAHILIRYRGASRASSEISRSQSDAETRAGEALQRVNGGEDFAAVAADMSDDVANKDHGGDMGRLERGLLPGPLDQALFGMEVGDVRGPIETPLGYHVIKRTE